jgi:hypothetical protein
MMTAAAATIKRGRMISGITPNILPGNGNAVN